MVCIGILIDQLRKIINMLILELENYNVGEKMHLEINNKLGEYSLTYFKFHQELIDYYND